MGVEDEEDEVEEKAEVEEEEEGREEGLRGSSPLSCLILASCSSFWHVAWSGSVSPAWMAASIFMSMASQKASSSCAKASASATAS